MESKKRGLFFTLSLTASLLLYLFALVFGYPFLMFSEFLTSITNTPFNYSIYLVITAFIIINIYCVFAVFNWKVWAIWVLIWSNFILFGFLVLVTPISIVSLIPIFVNILVSIALFFEKEKEVWFQSK